MTQAEMEKAISEVWALFRETREQINTVSHQMANTDKKMAITDRKLEKLIDNWGRFVEYILAPGIPRAFQEIGINIEGVGQRMKRTRGGEQMEIDILGINTDCVLVVEVKTTFRPENVSDFLERLPRFKAFFTEYEDKKVYGAVAAIDFFQASEVKAAKNGLYVITQSGDTVTITNEDNFQPKTW